MSNTLTDPPPAAVQPVTRRRPQKASSRMMVLIRRFHLYAGLFLLPWVLLYGVTGAMYNHQGLFPEATIRSIPPRQLTASPLTAFPNPAELAQHVVEALQTAAPDATIQLADKHGAEFSNDLVFEVRGEGERHAVHINPINLKSKVVTHPASNEPLEPLLPEVHNIKVTPNPYLAARDSVGQILKEAGVKATHKPQPLGWSKLNFEAEVDGNPARVTYVLRDGHVDITRQLGEDGMSLRQFLLRLHTSHGQPPHWNGRMVWSVGVDVMAIAMVSWALTGICMWWQIKRVRITGGIVLVLSLSTAALLYLSMLQFYATTKL